MKSALQAIVRRMGYEIKRAPSGNRAITPYQAAILALYSKQRKIKIVQVGANDGVTNDPLFPTIEPYPDRSDILLIEPQTSILPHLKRNYSFHPSHWVFNGAAGPLGELHLFTVKEEFWAKLNVPYAKGWPLYRAPTGIASASKSSVHDWLAQHLQAGNRAEEAIEEICVPCKPLQTILAEHGWGPRIDVLQIDAEGFDDQIIYSSAIEISSPSIINFEAINLSAEKYADVEIYLTNMGYTTIRDGQDALAIRTLGWSASSRADWDNSP